MSAPSEKSSIFRRYIYLLVLVSRTIMLLACVISAIIFVLVLVQIVFSKNFGYPKSAIVFSSFLIIGAFTLFKLLGVLQKRL